MTDLSVLASRAIGRRDEAQSARDRIFVRDYVLPIHIGVYPEEQGITQKVGFTVEADSPA